MRWHPAGPVYIYGMSFFFLFQTSDGLMRPVPSQSWTLLLSARSTAYPPQKPLKSLPDFSAWTDFHVVLRAKFAPVTMFLPPPFALPVEGTWVDPHRRLIPYYQARNIHSHKPGVQEFSISVLTGRALTHKFTQALGYRNHASNSAGALRIASMPSYKAWFPNRPPAQLLRSSFVVCSKPIILSPSVSVSRPRLDVAGSR